MRAITPAIAEQLAAARVTVALLAELDTQPEPVRAWTGIGNLTWAGKTFVGVGHLGGISPIRETAAEVRANGVTFQLSGIPSELLAVALTTPYQGRPARLWLAFLSAAYREQVLALEPAGYWRLSETTAPFLDLSGNGHHLNALGSPTPGVAGLLVDDPDSAVALPGTLSDGIGVTGVPAGLAFGTGDFWVAGLMRATDLSGGRVLINTRGSWGSASGHPGWRLEVANGRLVFEIADGTNHAAGNLSPVPFFEPNATYHIIVNVDRDGVARAYINGVLRPETVPIANVTGSVDPGDNFRIGLGGVGGSGFAGVLDEWACGAGLLSDAQAKRLYDAAIGRTAALPAYLVADPVLLFDGRMDVMAIDEGAETSTITVTAESRLADLTRLRERRYTDEDQRQLFPGDRGLEYVAGLQKKLDTMQWANNKVQFFPVTVGEPGAA